MTKLRVIDVPSIEKPIAEAPGFQKKELADFKLDVMGRCAFQCSYCSTNHGLSLTFRKRSIADAAQAQLGEALDVTNEPGVTVRWPDVLPKLRAQIARHPRSWGAGKTLVVSMLTDAFSPLALADGTTEAALTAVMEGTSFRVRVLTKGAVVGSAKWIEFFKRWTGRFVVGLSIGTLDDEWARRIEVGTSSPTARLAALSRLQDAGVPTFGMLCPVFPHMLFGDDVERLVDAIHPKVVEHVWAEPYNDRANWQAVRAGYAEGTPGWSWLTAVYQDRRRDLWSAYAAELYERIAHSLEESGSGSKLRYLLYEDQIAEREACRFRGFRGVLLQSKPSPDGLSENPWIRAEQERLKAGAS
jgi:DNA repair photolyase